MKIYWYNKIFLLCNDIVLLKNEFQGYLNFTYLKVESQIKKFFSTLNFHTSINELSSDDFSYFVKNILKLGTSSG